MQKDFRDAVWGATAGELEWLESPYRDKNPELTAKILEAQTDRIALKNELAEHGVLVDCVYDLYRVGKGYDEVIPILVKHLAYPYPSNYKEGIALALCVPAAFPYWDKIKEEYDKTNAVDHPFLKTCLARTLCWISKSYKISELIEMAKSCPRGDARATIVYYLRKFKRKAIVSAFFDELKPEEGYSHSFNRWLQSRNETKSQ